MKAKIKRSIDALGSWVEAHDYKAYDPGDGNLSWFNIFTFNNLLLERLLQQSVYRAPINLRPLYGIKPHTSTKGMGYMAWGYIKLHRLTGETSYRDRAVTCLDWLIKNKSPGYPQFCWGNHFPFSTRSGKTPAFEPIIPWSALIAEAFLEAYQVLRNEKYLEVAVSVADWLLALPREKTSNGDCLSYVAFKQNSIHNANMLGAAVLAQVGALTQNEAALKVAHSAMLYSCSRQEPDGAWFYGEATKYRWIDNFHTGYNLDSLRRYAVWSKDQSFDQQAQRGFSYLKRNFFNSDGRPKYYHNKVYPTDIQCAAQAIDTLTLFSDGDPEALGLAKKVALWTIDHMQDPDGHFYYRDLGWAMNKTPMLHWGQGTMFKALANLLVKLEGGLQGPRSLATPNTTVFDPHAN